MEYLTVKELDLTGQMINYFCSAGRIKGAAKKENLRLYDIIEALRACEFGGRFLCVLGMFENRYCVVTRHDGRWHRFKSSCN